MCSFINLTTLNIADNSEIIALSSELGRLKNLTNLNLEGLNDLNDAPKCVHFPATACIKYLNSRLCSAHEYYCIKMMFLVNKQWENPHLWLDYLTKIFSVSPQLVLVSVSRSIHQLAVKTFHFSIWDFAGQKEYYATHQCFLFKHSLYLLAWNITERDTGIDDLKPWLNNIAARAPGSSAIIVGTFLDEVSEEDRRSGIVDIHSLLYKAAELSRQYDQLIVTNIIVVGLKGQMKNVAKLKDNIYNTAAEYKVKGQCVMGQLIPSSYHALDSKLATIHCL